MHTLPTEHLAILDRYDANLSASLVYDYSGVPLLPDRLLPKADSRREAMNIIASKAQLFGTNADLVSEIAGRACYDSFGKGRSSMDYHQHLIQVNHGSVWAHFNFTVEFDVAFTNLPAILLVLLNRPGVHVAYEATPFGAIVRITANLRAAREWSYYAPGEPALREVADRIRVGVQTIASIHAPQVMDATFEHHVDADGFTVSTPAGDFRMVDPSSDEEKWVTLFLSGSRGFTHELVRHGWRTAMSQRSTRYVDESGSKWVEHPLVTEYSRAKDYASNPLFVVKIPDDSKATNFSEYVGEAIYDPVVERLQAWLLSMGTDALTARKQARGAARGFLGNALYTEIVFSASVAQWKRIMKQRLNPAADAEIRVVAARALDVLKACKYGDDFRDFNTALSPDGIGLVLA